MSLFTRSFNRRQTDSGIFVKPTNFWKGNIFIYPKVLPPPLLFTWQNPLIDFLHCKTRYGGGCCFNQEGDLANIEKICSMGGYGGADLLLTSNWARGVDVELPEVSYAQLLQLGVSPSVAGEVRFSG